MDGWKISLNFIFIFYFFAQVTSLILFNVFIVTRNDLLGTSWGDDSVSVPSTKSFHPHNSNHISWLKKTKWTEEINEWTNMTGWSQSSLKQWYDNDLVNVFPLYKAESNQTFIYNWLALGVNVIQGGNRKKLCFLVVESLQHKLSA